MSKQDHLYQRAVAIHKRIIALDTHADIDVQNFTTEQNYTQEDFWTQISLPRMERGGLNALFLIVYTPQGELTDKGYQNAYAIADEKFRAIHRLVEEIAPDRAELATTAEEVRKIYKKGKRALLIGVENGYPLGEDLSKIKEFYDRGARYMSLTHNGHNQLADSHTGEENGKWLHQGLSPLGKKAIAELNRLGIIIDLSHPAQSTNKQIIELSKAPVVATHSAARALNDVSRNLWDQELWAIKKKGGVVQVIASPRFLNGKKDALHKKAIASILRQTAKEKGLLPLVWADRRSHSFESDGVFLNHYRALVRAAMPRIKQEVFPYAPPVNVEDLVDHIDYMVTLMGIDHVGIGSDFDGGGGVYHWDDPSESLQVTLELVKRGYQEEEIKKLWGENFFRVMDRVQQIAKEIQSGIR